MTDNFWIKLAEKDIDSVQSIFQFWRGIDVWIERPHLLNRKLLGNEKLHTFSSPFTSDTSDSSNYDESYKCYMKEFFGCQEFHKCLFVKYVSDRELDENSSKNILITFRKLIPRNLNKFCEVLEAVIKDEVNNAVIFWPRESDVHESAITPEFPYRIRMDGGRIFLEIYEKKMISSAKEQASKEWLKSCVFPKIIKWCCSLPSASIILPSLTLVSAGTYGINYNHLKNKYGKKYVEMWPEVSDPLKFVYEDIAIAAYLITLWKKEEEDLNLTSKQTFVDIGCGNGLLVNILASEGYNGIGIDVRKRKIWDLYENCTTLIEKAVEPSDYHIFPNYDWIIGNHCDELTPWIPVIAARSSYKMRVFLLPCCAYSFNSKYERCSEGKTQYQSYLSWIHSLCVCMGFKVQQDKLRIPSTKRTCFICASRTYKEEDDMAIDLKRREFIEINSRKTERNICIPNVEPESEVNQERNLSSSSKETHWIANFKPREKLEVVQNCTQLDRTFLENTVISVANLLLKTENYISLQKGKDQIIWNSGGKIKLSNLIDLIDPSILKCMKNQCGGFQTFLRNHRNVFQILDGEVQLNVPLKGLLLNSKPANKRRRSMKKIYCFKEKPCFFFNHHPQGCPLEDSECNFSHKIL